jgi:hypothetical protein
MFWSKKSGNNFKLKSSRCEIFKKRMGVTSTNEVKFYTYEKADFIKN